MAKVPMMSYLREVLDEHTIPLEDPGTGIIEAVWLAKMLHETDAVYRQNGF